MENFVGLLYNSGTTQEGVGYKNGFGSVYAISGFTGLDQTQINVIGINEQILETEGFIFWTKFKLTSANLVGLNLFSSVSRYYGTTIRGCCIYIGTDNTMNFNLYNTDSSFATFPLNYRIGLFSNVYNSNFESSSTFNVLIYKDPSKNFTQTSAFTTNLNGFKNVITNSLPYSYNTILVQGGQIEPMRWLFMGSFPSPPVQDCVGVNGYIYNYGLSKTTMTPAEFDLFAQKMLKYDNYWHLFEGETDTPNIKQSEIILYTPFYQKFGGNNISANRINIMYPKTGVSAYTTSNTNLNQPILGVDNSSRAKLNMTLGAKNRWRRPYPPFDPYI